MFIDIKINFSCNINIKYNLIFILYISNPSDYGNKLLKAN